MVVESSPPSGNSSADDAQEQHRGRRLGWLPDRMDLYTEPRPNGPRWLGAYTMDVPNEWSETPKKVLTTEERRQINDRLFNHRMTRTTFLMVFMTPYLLYTVFWVEKGNEASIAFDIAIPAISLLVVSFFWKRYRDTRRELYVTVDLVKILWVLDSNKAEWLGRPSFAKVVCPMLARLARRVSRTPLSLRSTHPGVVTAAERKAAAIDDLQLWVSTPLDTTYEDLRERLGESLVLVNSGRWYELPESDEAYIRVMTKMERWTWGIGGLIVIAAGIAAGIFDSSMPSFVKFVAPLAIASGVLCLGRAGLVPGTLQQALDTSSSIKASAPGGEE